MEVLGLRALLLMKINRPDLAKDVLKEMKGINEDFALAKLVDALVRGRILCSSSFSGQ